MRKHGVRRARKPWSGAADMHIPLGDTIIGKLKAYYVQWVFGPELLASFYSLETQGDSYTDSVAQWFDYKVRECSNFTRAAMCAMDTTLQNGVGLIKTYWDALKSVWLLPVFTPISSLSRPGPPLCRKPTGLLTSCTCRKPIIAGAVSDCGYNMDDDFIDSHQG